jgi:hypothetical protein
MSYAYVGTTDVTNLGQAVIASMVQEQLVEAFRLPPIITDYTSLVEPGSKSVAIPYAADLSATAKTEDTEIVAAAYTAGVSTLNLTNHYYVANDVEDYAQWQSKVALVQDLISRHANALADQIDTLVYDQIKLGSSTGPDHLIDYTDGANNDLQVDDFAAVAKLAAIAKWPAANRFLVIPPTQLANLLKIDTFVEADKFGSRESLLNGFFGRLYGFDVIVSNTAESDNYSIFLHKSAAGIAFQSPVKVEINRNPKNISNIIISHFNCGCMYLDPGTSGSKRCVRVYAAA